MWPIKFGWKPSILAHTVSGLAIMVLECMGGPHMGPCAPPKPIIPSIMLKFGFMARFASTITSSMCGWNCTFLFMGITGFSMHS